MIVTMSLMGSLFICSFSSILSAVVLIMFTFILLSVMYWNMMSVIPLYLFSLFTLGGLYVLVGFVMMADMRDLDMIFDSKGLTSFLMSFFFIFFGLEALVDLDYNELSYSDESFIKTVSSETNLYFSSTFIFLILFLFIFLFIAFMMMKGSWGGGGFVI